MKVTMRNWQPNASGRQYKNPAISTDQESVSEKDPEVRMETGTNPYRNVDHKPQINTFHPVQDQAQDEKILLSAMPGQDQEKESLLSSLLEKEQEQKSLFDSLLEQAKGSSSFKMSVSMPEDSVGQLATELARSETKMNVLQVSSKAMRALANLKMAYALSEGKDKEKIGQMIRRMQKLTRQIQKKVKNLSKEEQLELRRKHAEERQEMEKELEIRKEIRSRRKKRRREENNYAAKEVGQDRKEAMQETMEAMAASMGGLSPAGLSAAAGVSGTASSAAAISVGTEAYTASMEAPMVDSVSVDVAI